MSAHDHDNADADKKPPEHEQVTVLWRMLQAFLWANVITGGLLALTAGPVFGRPNLWWAGAILGAPSFVGIVWVEWRVRRLKKKVSEGTWKLWPKGRPPGLGRDKKK